MRTCAADRLPVIRPAELMKAEPNFEPESERPEGEVSTDVSIEPE